MKNVNQINAEYFFKELENFYLLDQFLDCFSDIDDGFNKAKNENSSEIKFVTGVEQPTSEKLLKYLEKYIGTNIPISAKEFSAALKRIKALRRDMAATSARLDRWAIDTHYVWEDVCSKIEFGPVEEWAERTAKQVQLSRQEAA